MADATATPFKTQDDFKNWLSGQNGAAKPPEQKQPAGPAFKTQDDFRQWLDKASPKPTVLGTTAGVNQKTPADLWHETHDYLFGKQDQPKDPGVVGKAWQRVKATPAGVEGVTIGQDLDTLKGAWDRFNNPFAMSNEQVAQHAKARDAANKAIDDKLGTGGKVGRYAMEGVENTAENFLSPMNVALMFTGYGEAKLAGAIGKDAAGVLGKLASTYWTAQMIEGTGENTKESYTAFMNGDYETGIKAAVGGIVNGFMAGHSLTHQVAQERVARDLDKKSQELYGQKTGMSVKGRFAQLSNEEKAHVVYEAVKNMPLYTDLGGEKEKLVPNKKRAALIEHAQLEPPPPFSDSFNARVDEAVARQEETEKQRAGLNAYVDAEKGRQDQRAAEMQRLDKSIEERTAEKRPSEESAQILDYPILSDHEREFQRHEYEAEQARKTLETERNESLRVDEDRKNRQKLYEAQQDENQDAVKQEMLRNGQMFSTVDRRANVSIREEMQAALRERLTPERETPETISYQQMSEEIRQHADNLFPGADPAIVDERLRAKERDGYNLSQYEQDYRRRYDTYERAENGLARNKEMAPQAYKMVEALRRQQVEDTLHLAKREEDLVNAAEELQRKAETATTPEEAEEIVGRAQEARKLAEEIRGQRQDLQARRGAAEETERPQEQPPISARTGRKTRIDLPGNARSMGARYAAVKLSDLKISHDPLSFQWRDNYRPRRLQPRDLSTNMQAQEAIITSSKPENYRHDRYTSDNPTAIEGPAVILPDGTVAGGNSRLARLIRALQTERRGEIITRIHSDMAKLGMETEDLYDGSDPYIPVRILDEPPKTIEDMIKLGQDLNTDTIMGFSTEEQAVMSGERLTPENVEAISAMLDTMPESASLREMLTARSDKILDMMTDSGIIPETKRAEYVTQDGKLTERAKQTFEEAILGKVIDDPDLLKSVPRETLAKVERSLPALLKIKTAAPEWNVMDYLKQSLRVWRTIDSIRGDLNDIGAKSDSLIDKYYNPQDFKMGSGLITFEEGALRDPPHPITEALAKLFEKNPLQVKKALDAYADDVEGRQNYMLGQPSPIEAFNRHIGEKVGVEVDPTEWGTLRPTSEEVQEEARKATLPPDLPKTPAKPQALEPPPAEKKAEKAAKPVEPSPVISQPVGTIEVPRTRLEATGVADKALSPQEVKSGKVSRVVDMDGRPFTPIKGDGGTTRLVAMFTPEEWGNRAKNQPGETVGKVVRHKGREWVLGGPDSEVVMKPGPTPEEATQQFKSAIEDGTVTSESLRALFESAPQTADAASELMDVFARVIPGALRGQSFDEFLKTAFADVRFAPETEAGKGLKQAEQNAPMWTLKSQQLIQQKMRGPMSGDALVKMLQNNGVKPDELKWLGLEDLVSEKKVTPEDVQRKIAENNLQIKEVEKGGEGAAPNDGWGSISNQPESTKFDSWTLPGGQNYRELLLTLPEVPGGVKGPKVVPHPDTPNNWAIQYADGSYEMAPNPAPDNKSGAARWDDRDQAEKRGLKAHDKTKFNSSHWDEANILTHIRFNDRTDAEGRKLLHIEEVQSDWHQKGRNKGYTNAEEVKRSKSELDAADKALKEAHALIRKTDAERLFLALRDDSSQEERAEANRAYNKANDEAKVLTQAFYRAEDAHDKLTKRIVPDAPFKKTWHELALKRMLRYAAQNGYDGVSWTKGADQADRYDLSKKIQWVNYKPATQELVATPHGMFNDQLRWTVPPEKVADYIGKEAAEKLLSSKPTIGGTHHIEGLDLKIGGEGMKGFYDKIIPDFLNKYGKQWGAKVGDTHLVSDKPNYSNDEFWNQISHDGRRGNMPLYAIIDSENRWSGTMGEQVEENLQPGERFVKVAEADGTLIRGAVDFSKPSERGKQLPFLPVTDAMRRGVMEEGQMLFAKEGGKVKGETQFLEDGRAIVRLFEKSDATTVLHEFFHVMRRYLSPADLKTLEEFAKVKDGQWETDHEEKVARAWEKYHYDGKAPTPAIKAAFDKLSEVFRNIYRHLTSSPINVKLTRSVRETFDKWYGAAPRDMEPPPGHDKITAPKETADVLTPNERENSKLIAKGGADITSRLSEARLKRFDHPDEAKAFAANNYEKLRKGIQIWQTQDGKSYALFIPDSPTTLYQRDPENMQEAIHRVDQLKRQLASESDFGRMSSMRREIDRLESKHGIGNMLTIGAPVEKQKTNIIKPGEMERPPDIRRPEEPTILFPDTEASHGRDTNAVRTVSDGPVLVPERGKAEGVAGRSGERRLAPSDRGSLLPVRDAGRTGSHPARGTERNSLSGTTPNAVAKPQRERGPALVDAQQWRERMQTLNMPHETPPPTVSVSVGTAILLKFPGQREVVETSLSALQQYDGTIVATPPGTGKTYTVLAIAKELKQPGHRQLIITRNNDIITADKGFQDVGKKIFNMEVKRLPDDLNKIGEGTYAMTYATLREHPELKNTAWDLVIADEAGEARRWWDSKQGGALADLSDSAAKMVYASATPYHTALEIGYMKKLGLWEGQGFDEWARQFGVRKNKEGKYSGGTSPKKLIKMRQQLIERGQYAYQSVNYDGYRAEFAHVPLTEEHIKGIQNIRTAFAEMENFFNMRGKPQLAAAVRGNGVNYMKNYLERVRLPQAIEVAKRLNREGWQVAIFSEHNQERAELYDFAKEADRAMGGRISQLLPKLPGVYDTLEDEFGDNIANFSGSFSAKRQGEKKGFLTGAKDYLFATYGAGGIGTSLHDDSPTGMRPRAAIYLGPPWSGVMLDQALGRLWRFGTKSNVHSIFMSSNAKPEVNMILTKIAPRMEALRAAIAGVDGNDPLVTAMRSLDRTRDELANYDMGGQQKIDISDFDFLQDDVPIANYKDIGIVSAENAKDKGMRYAGQVDETPGVITLFQEHGDLNVPPPFKSPEQHKVESYVSSVSKDLAEGNAVPGAPEGIQGIDTSDRTKMADGMGPDIQRQADIQGEADKQATARIASEASIAHILAAQRAGDVKLDPESPEWSMTYPLGEAEARARRSEETYRVTVALNGRQQIESNAAMAGRADIGRSIHNDILDYHATGQGITGRYISDWYKVKKEIGGISKKEFRTMVMVKEGKIPSPSEKISKAVAGLTGIFNGVRQTMEDRGIENKRYIDGKPAFVTFADIPENPNFFPHRWNHAEKIEVTDPTTGETESFTLAQLIGGTLGEQRRNRILAAISKEHGISIAEVEDWLQQRKTRTPVAGNIERSRQANMPFYRMDESALFEYLDNVGEVLAREEVFGQDRGKLDGKVSQIPNAKSRETINNIMDSLLSPAPWSNTRMQQLYRKFTTANVLMKMTFSTVKLPGHLAHTMLVQGQVRQVLKAVLQSAASPREARERALFSGALADQVIAHAATDEGVSKGFANKMLNYTGFHAMYNVDRIIANKAAQNWMEKYALPRLIKKSKSSDYVRRQLKEIYLLPDEKIDAAIENGRWSKEDIDRGGVALTNKTLFVNDPTEVHHSLRPNARSDMGQNMEVVIRTMTMLKGFTFRTAALLKERLIDEARQGNYRSWVPFILAYPIIGEALRAGTAAAHGAVAAMTNKKDNPFEKYAEGFEELFDDPSVAKFAARYIEDEGASTGLEMFSHIFNAIVLPVENERMARLQRSFILPDFIEYLGGGFTTLYDTGKAGIKAINSEGDREKFAQAVLDYVREEAPAVGAILPKKMKDIYEFEPFPANQ